ncbi:hypothetical protein AC579_5537 [Pseudocercospora musae]|uniref:Cupin type-1 domain-containing protein n=1 Tax=Pseudocercospora musae TaxID=113226 RepID=A0A139IMU4_9PEZI|nr:hypothetical protein AC579_5537 [Pseudocercospora musae]
MMSSTKVAKTYGIYHLEGRPRETFKILARHRPSNIPGKSLIVGLVDMEPNAASTPHTHGGSAVLNQVNSSVPFEVTKGGMWYEAPGCHRVRGENASETEQASFFAVFVVDDEVVKDGYDGLVVVDQAVIDAKTA